jgi:DNA-binding CsgD family transcriptional regulator
MLFEMIRIVRLREAMSLVREVHELGRCTEAAREHLLRGVLRIVGAEFGAAVVDGAYEPGKNQGIEAATLANFDQEIIALFTTHNTLGSSVNPYHRAMMEKTASASIGDVLTHTNDELMTRDVWTRSPWVQEYVRPARVDHFLGTIGMIGTARGEGLAFMRGSRSRPFSKADRELLNLIHIGVGRFFDMESSPPRLSPRLRETLDGLLSGGSDKAIAARMGISPHTVREYIQAVYRAYGVSTRAALFASCARLRP